MANVGFKFWVDLRRGTDSLGHAYSPYISTATLKHDKNQEQSLKQMKKLGTWMFVFYTFLCNSEGYKCSFKTVKAEAIT